MKKAYVYSNFTYNSRNPLARFSHRTRIVNAIHLTLEKEFKSILDYGAGDNIFLNHLHLKNPNLNLFAFEPVMPCKSTKEIKVFSNLNDLNNRKFDVVTCFETLEHFNESAQLKMLKSFYDLLNKNGRVIISVPIETGFPSLVKNIRRMSYENNEFTNVKNSFKSLFAIDIPEIRNLNGFIPTHVGFNHKKLEKLFLKRFTITKKVNSPFKRLPSQLNSQVFYILEKKVINK